MRRCRYLLPLIVAALLAACAGPAPEPVSEPAVKETPAPTPRTEKSTEPRLSAAARQRLARSNLKPITTRPLTAATECRFRDETGYGGRLALEVSEAQVKRFSAQVDIPRRGSCRFDLENFQQSASLPNVELTARRSRCRVHLWEQADQVTVAFRDCRTECSGKSAEYLWPILVDNRDGSCS